jgi:multidrug efflux pump subunit AcrB
MDDGRVRIDFVADTGTSLDAMDALMARVEGVVLAQPEVDTAFAEIGGFVFGRSQYEASNRGRFKIQLRPASETGVSSAAWIARMKKEVAALRIAGARIRMRTEGIRGLRLQRSDDDVSIRVRGQDLRTLADIGDEIVRRLEPVSQVSNVRHTYETRNQELEVQVDRERAAAFGLDVEQVGRAVRTALQGTVVTDYMEGDRSFDVRLRLPRDELASPRDLEHLLLPISGARAAVRLGDIAALALVNTPAEISRDRQQRIVEVSGNVSDGATLGQATAEVERVLADLRLPPGYSRYDGGASDALARTESLFLWLLGLALFLVLVVMAVQYESLRNPLIILFSVPFAAVGVAIAVDTLAMPLSMPLWLGMIMLAGIVVNNAIVFIEYVEIARRRGLGRDAALRCAAHLRLRPILMTTLTTVVGMSPLALGVGEGSEMLRPLAITIVYGLSFSSLVSLVLVPCLYRLMTPDRPAPAAVGDAKTLPGALP